MKVENEQLQTSWNEQLQTSWTPEEPYRYSTVYLVGSAEAVFSKFFKLLENGLKRCVLLSYTHILGFSLGGQ